MNNDEALQLIKHLIGTRYVPSVKAYLTELTGRERGVGVNDASTKDINPNRIQIRGDEKLCIVGFNFT